VSSKRIKTFSTIIDLQFDFVALGQQIDLNLCICVAPLCRAELLRASCNTRNIARETGSGSALIRPL
jgi:hypothetical protein